MAGFGGLRDHGEKLAFAPRLPARLERLGFRLVFRGNRLKVDATKERATYILVDGPPIEIAHHGKTITLTTSAPVTEPIPPVPFNRQPPTQPHGRAPAARSRMND